MDKIEEILEGNSRWKRHAFQKNPEFFKELSVKQNPSIFWIGCSDSRILASRITGTGPGELFVHRNVGNITTGSDPNFLAALEYAVHVLHVTYIIVCGHYGCGAVLGAIEGVESPHVQSWISPIQNIFRDNSDEFNKLSTLENKASLLSEKNIVAQVHCIRNTEIVRNVLKTQRTLKVRGMIYSLESGELKELPT